MTAKRIISKRSLKKLDVKFVMDVTFMDVDNIKFKKLANYCPKSRVLIFNFVVSKKFKAMLNYYNNNNIMVNLMSKSKFFRLPK